MRVLAIIDSLGGGGTERSLAELLTPLRDRGVEVTVATLRPAPAGTGDAVGAVVDRAGVAVHRLPAGVRRVPAFRRLIRQTGASLVHSMLFDANLTARLAGLGTGVPLVTSLVNTTYAPERLDTLAIARWKLAVVHAVDDVSGRRVDRFHAVSEAVADDAVAHLHVPRARVTVVPRGRVDPAPTTPPDARARVRAELGIGDDAVVVVAVGRHEPQKDHATLLAAAGPLLVDEDRLWVLIAGKEGVSTAELSARRDAMAHGDRVLLLGHRADVPALLAASDLFVLASRHEGMPGAMIEAMAMGLPVVGTDIGPVREVAGPAEVRLVVPGDVAGLRTVLAALVDDPVARQRMGASARARYEAALTIDAAADGMVALYRSVVVDK